MTSDRQDIDLEELLWQLSARQEGSAPAPDDAALRAYREGRLGPEAATAVERALAESRQGRERLAQLAEIEPEGPPAELRARILAQAPGRAGLSAAPGRGRVLESAVKFLRRPRGRWGLALAATVLLATVAWRFFVPAGLPADLQFQVSASGLAEVRGEQHVTGPISAGPDTVVTLTMEPVGQAVNRVDFALYRLRDRSLERVDTLPGVNREVYRGAARFSARAAMLAGPTPMPKNLFLVAARPGDLPDRFELADGADAEATLRGEHRRRVVRQEIQLEVGVSR
jgi:hypothetical protein